jgi:enamine deaminase RidA (YjgF/YER057c/UK114 family)
MPRTILPEGWPRPKGYANGMAAEGELLAIAGQVAWDEREQIVSESFVAQFRKALENVVAVVIAAGGAPEHLVSITIYVTRREDYADALAEIGAVWREVVGRHYPAMALVVVAGLLETGALVEIQGLAVLPEHEDPRA